MKETSEEGAATQFDLSGGSALAQKIWEDMDADTLADRAVIIAGDPKAASTPSRCTKPPASTKSNSSWPPRPSATLR